MIRDIRHIGIVVADLDVCLQFWQDVMGLSVIKRMDEAGPHIDAITELRDVKVTTVKLAAPDGNLVELLNFKTHDGGPAWTGNAATTGLTHFAMTVDDLEAEYVRLQKHGVRFHAPPQRSPDGYAKMTYCRGPEGLILELVEVLQR